MISRVLREYEDRCTTDECDTFQFMAKKLRVKVLHPGGLGATESLAKKCGISSKTTLLDVGCGRGSSTIFLARRYGCRVVGVDLDQTLLLEAQRTALATGVADRVAFRVGDTHSLPFEDWTFDGAIVQAVLIFTEKEVAMRQLCSKIRPGGFVGVIELAWKKIPPEQVRERVTRALCAAVVNSEEHKAWADLLRHAGLTVEYAELKDGGFSFGDMVRSEGLLSALRIAGKCVLSAEVRTKISEISTLFKETQEYLGYGLYVGRKTESN